MVFIQTYLFTSKTIQMKIEIKEKSITITREETDKKYYGIANGAGESKFLHDLKRELNKQGYDLIKKRMWKDGHMVDDMQQYLRARKKGSGVADIAIFSPFWAIRGANEDFNNGVVTLCVVRNIFE